MQPIATWRTMRALLTPRVEGATDCPSGRARWCAGASGLAILLLMGVALLGTASPARADLATEMKYKLTGNPDDAFKIAAEYAAKRGESNAVSAIDWYYRAGDGYLKKNQLKMAESALGRMKKLDPNHPQTAKLEDEIGSAAAYLQPSKLAPLPGVIGALDPRTVSSLRGKSADVNKGGDPPPLDRAATAYFMADGYARGESGLKKDRTEALAWYQQAGLAFVARKDQARTCMVLESIRHLERFNVRDYGPVGDAAKKQFGTDCPNSASAAGVAAMSKDAHLGAQARDRAEKAEKPEAQEQVRQALWVANALESGEAIASNAQPRTVEYLGTGTMAVVGSGASGHTVRLFTWDKGAWALSKADVPGEFVSAADLTGDGVPELVLSSSRPPQAGSGITESAVTVYRFDAAGAKLTSTGIVATTRQVEPSDAQGCQSEAVERVTEALAVDAAGQPFPIVEVTGTKETVDRCTGAITGSIPVSRRYQWNAAQKAFVAIEK